VERKEAYRVDAKLGDERERAIFGGGVCVGGFNGRANRVILRHPKSVTITRKAVDEFDRITTMDDRARYIQTPRQKKLCECGVPTCLAFAMMWRTSRLSSRNGPYVSPEVVQQLEAPASPPMRTVTVGDLGKIGAGNRAVSDHEKKFFKRRRHMRWLNRRRQRTTKAIVERAKKLDAMKYERDWHHLRR